MHDHDTTDRPPTCARCGDDGWGVFHGEILCANHAEQDFEDGEHVQDLPAGYLGVEWTILGPGDTPTPDPTTPGEILTFPTASAALAEILARAAGGIGPA